MKRSGDSWRAARSAFVTGRVRYEWAAAAAAAARHARNASPGRVARSFMTHLSPNQHAQRYCARSTAPR